MCEIGLLTPVYGVSGVFCAAQTIRCGPFSPPACDHQLASGPRAGAAAVAAAGVWARAGAATNTVASAIHVVSDFTEASCREASKTALMLRRRGRGGRNLSPAAAASG